MLLLASKVADRALMFSDGLKNSRSTNDCKIMSNRSPKDCSVVL